MKKEGSWQKPDLPPYFIRPIEHLMNFIGSTPEGLLALAGRFGFLGLGTAFALTRKWWQDKIRKAAD